MEDDIFNYKGPKLTVDVVTFLYNLKTFELKVLLVKRDNDPFRDKYALPGGFIHDKENTHQTAVRVLKEKAGISSLYLEQVKTFDGKNRDPRGQVFSVVYMSLVNEELLPDGLNKDLVQTFTLKKLLGKKTKLAFDHRDIITYAYQRLKAKVLYSNLSTLSMPKYFTLSELQTVFEVVLAEKLDKRNFRKKITNFGFLIETDQSRKGQSKRPAKLYQNKYKRVVTYDRPI